MPILCQFCLGRKQSSYQLLRNGEKPPAMRIPGTVFAGFDFAVSNKNAIFALPKT